MEASLLFVPAEPADYAAIADIYNCYVQDGNQTMEERIHSPEDIANWISHFNERERLLVLKKEDKVLGWGIIKKYSTRAGYRYACETAVYLQPGEIRKGYGSLMKKRLITHCKALGYHHMVAKIFATNLGSIVYNQKLGYEIVGTQKEIGYKNGQWMDMVIMQYIIK
jgi:L-amino acid N-acyltransferase YncA